MPQYLARIVSSALLCSGGVVSAAEPEDAMFLYPQAAEAIKVVVSAGPRDVFEAVAAVRVKARRKGEIVLEVDEAGRVLRRVTAQRVARKLYFHVPGLSRKRARRTFVIYLGVRDETRTCVPPPRLNIENNAGATAVTNDYYAAAIAPGDGRFFPAVGLPGTDRLARDIYLDDRLWDRAAEKKGHWLRKDRRATARIEQAGPLVAVVSVEADYRHSADDKGVAQARYTYEFRAGTPLIRVTADVRQSTDRAWNELHFLHISHKGYAYPNWATGQPRNTGVFADTRKSWRASQWGVIHNGQLAVGLVMPKGQQMTLYDNPSGFCEYVRHTVKRWNTREQHFEGTLFIGPWQGLEAMTQTVLSTSGVDVLSTQTIDRRAVLAARTPLQRWTLMRKVDGLPYWPGGAVDTNVAKAVVRRSGEWLLLHNAQFAALFHRQGGLMGLTDVNRGRDFIQSGQGALAWEIQVGKAAGESRWVSSRDCQPPAVAVREAAGGAEIRFRWGNAPRETAQASRSKLRGGSTRRACADACVPRAHSKAKACSACGFP